MTDLHHKSLKIKIMQFKASCDDLVHIDHLHRKMLFSQHSLQRSGNPPKIKTVSK